MGNTQVKSFLIGNVSTLDVFWIAAQGRNDVCCHLSEANGSWHSFYDYNSVIARLCEAIQRS
ncbi:MAG: hypothetical protein LBV04_08535 [Deferribacteraceae bacterium]|nr:hypothetical protein [Deferribacteraceae bacterium]